MTLFWLSGECTVRMAVVMQLSAGILLGVMGTDVPLSDFLDTVPQHKVTYCVLPTTYTCLGCSCWFYSKSAVDVRYFGCGLLQRTSLIFTRFRWMFLIYTAVWEVKKVKMCVGLYWNPSQSYGASPVKWDHTVSPATRRRWTRPALTPAMQAGTRFTYPRGMGGWVDLGGWLFAVMCSRYRIW